MAPFLLRSRTDTRNAARTSAERLSTRLSTRLSRIASSPRIKPRRILSHDKTDAVVAIKRRAEIEAEGMRLDNTFGKLKSEEAALAQAAAAEAGGASVVRSPQTGGAEASHAHFEAQSKCASQ